MSGLQPDSRAARFYGQDVISEQYYCNFGLNPTHQARLDQGGLRVVGTDQNGEARVLGLPDRRFYIATLFVPQLTSRFDYPHPLIIAYLRAVIEFSAERPAAQADADRTGLYG